jgi:hypothetical protein
MIRPGPLFIAIGLDQLSTMTASSQIPSAAKPENKIRFPSGDNIAHSINHATSA